MLYWFLNMSGIYIIPAPEVFIARFCGATAAVAATLLLVPVTRIVVDNLRRVPLMTRLFNFDSNISSALPGGPAVLHSAAAGRRLRRRRCRPPADPPACRPTRACPPPLPPLLLLCFQSTLY